MHLVALVRASLAAAVWLGTAGAWAYATPEGSAPAVIIESFSAGGREQPLVLRPGRSSAQAPSGFRSYEPVRLPVTAQALDFRIAPNASGAEEPLRIQYRLEGWDDEWREIEGVMWLSIRFLDEQGRRISSSALPRSGQSAGWKGSPQAAQFRVTTDVVVPPPRSRQIQIFLAAGGPRTMGTWLVKSIRLFANPGPGAPERVLWSEHILRGDDLDDPRGAPLHWRREGTNAGIPQVFTLDRAKGAYALALIDTDVRSTGRWGSRNIINVEPGVPVRIEIEEAYSIGAAGNYTCTYHKLPAGEYTFTAIPVDEFGVQAATGVKLPLALVPPFYATGWFWAVIATVSVGGVAGGVRYVTRRRMQRKLEQAERGRAVEAERIRIAQDLHDDLGARLTQLSLLSGLLSRKTANGSPESADLKRLDRTAREMTIALDEIVWAINPAHDTLEGVGNYISQHVTELVADSAARCRLEIPALLPARFIPSGARHHLLMSLKEAVNNALKHSGATEIRVQLACTGATLTLVVADNGRGFDPAAVVAGNGIANMKRRMEAAQGACDVQSSPGRGATVTLSLRLDHEPSQP